MGLVTRLSPLTAGGLREWGACIRLPRLRCPDLRSGRLQAGPGCGQQGGGGSGLGCTVPWETGPASWPAVHSCTRLGAAVLQWKPPDLRVFTQKRLISCRRSPLVWVTLQGSQPHAQASQPHAQASLAAPCGGSAILPSCPWPPGGRGGFPLPTGGDQSGMGREDGQVPLFLLVSFLGVAPTPTQCCNWLPHSCFLRGESQK